MSRSFRKGLQPFVVRAFLFLPFIFIFLFFIFFVFLRRFSKKKKILERMEKNQLGRLLLLLLLTFVFCCLFFYMPGHVGNIPLKRVDMFSELRTTSRIAAIDTLQETWLEEDTVAVDSVALQRAAAEKAGMDSLALAVRDSLYKALYAVEGSDSTGHRVEDYSVGHVGLTRFFTAIRNRMELGRPVRVAFLGDSFIEGDILVADFRTEMQRRFGGRGVGFVPIASAAAQYRPTVKTQSKGWTTWSMLTDHEHPYTLSCMTFEGDTSEASFAVEAGKRYPELDSVPCLHFIYEKNTHTEMLVSVNGTKDSLRVSLPPTDSISQWTYRQVTHRADFRFVRAKGFRALGVVMETDEGITVDNYSMRGNSGAVLERLDSASCRTLNALRPYDLIVLQYGLNVANDSVMQYGWYAKRMEGVVQHVRKCFPSADILLMGVSDRSRQENGAFYTMPSVLALLHAQRQAARRAGVVFWNTFGAMGGKNSMVSYVEKNWASKDYTHLGFGGGRELARILTEALLEEMKFYEEADAHETKK